MHPFKDIITEFKSIPADYRAEVLAAEIEANQHVNAELWFKAVSTFRRPTAKDVSALEWEEGPDGRDRLFFIVNREGLYDMIPQGVTHYSPAGEGRNRAAFVEEIKYQRQQEAQARRFFLPIEDEFFHLRLKLERMEREFDNSRNSDRNRELFEALFGDSTPFDDLQVLTLLYLLPLAHRIRGDAELMAFCMSRVLGYQVSVTKKWQASHVDTPADLPGLDGMTLGMNSILSGGCETVVLHYHLSVHGIEPGGYRHFMTGGTGDQILQRLISWFLPVHIPIATHLNPEDVQPAWVMGDEEVEAFMGCNTCI